MISWFYFVVDHPIVFIKLNVNVNTAIDPQPNYVTSKSCL